MVGLLEERELRVLALISSNCKASSDISIMPQRSIDCSMAIDTRAVPGRTVWMDGRMMDKWMVPSLHWMVEK